MVADSLPSERVVLRSFDRSSEHLTTLIHPDRYRHIDQLRALGGFIPRGGGYSYVAASVDDELPSVDTRAFDRILALSTSDATVDVEAGVTIGALSRFLHGRGFWLPPLPGYPGITIGGCIAFDVHGKNPAKHGTFRNWVHSLTLFHPEQGWIAADEGSNTEWLELACGGLGLTGLIVRARLKVKPLNGPTVQVRHMKVAGYQALLEILRERSPIDEFVYALARPGTLLRAPLASASVTLGNIAQGSVGPAPERKRDALLDPNGGDRKAPFTIFNDRTGAVSSLAFWLGTRLQDGSKSPISLDGFLFPFAGAHLYFKLFGRAGFREHQLLIPWASAAEFGRALAAALEKHRPPIALIALKAFDGPQSYLRFNGCGLSMVLDLPNVPGSARFSALLDELVVAHGGIPNIAKDSRLSSVTARQCYREFGRFENGVRSLPGGARSRSMVARRLGLLE